MPLPPHPFVPYVLEDGVKLFASPRTVIGEDLSEWGAHTFLHPNRVKEAKVIKSSGFDVDSSWLGCEL
jgi:hypothetical protein